MDWCLVTDIDGTLIDEAESTAELRRRVLEARAGLARAGARLHWVVATGRTYASTCEVLRERVLGALGELPFKITTVFALGDYLDVAPERAVAAGDSGNDLSMLAREWRAIVVKNGHGELELLRGKLNVFFA